MRSLRSLGRTAYIQGRLAQEWFQSGVIYNPLSAGVIDDPYPTYRRLQQRDPAHWSPLLNAWIFSRYEDTDEVLRDQDRFEKNEEDPLERRRELGMPDDPEFVSKISMLFLNPPDHTRLRSLVSKAFTPRAVAALEPRIRELAHELLDGAGGEPQFDMMDVLAYPLPTIVISEMLGIPAEDRAQFKEWSDALARQIEPNISHTESRAAWAAAAELDAYFGRIIEQRRTEPSDDMISALIAAENEGDQLDHEELIVMLRLLLVAGNETTTNLVGNGLLALLQHPEQLALLREDPELMPKAVEEFLRFDSPVQLDARSAAHDTRLGGRQISAGQTLIVLIGAANHDPATFPNPERLDITREHASNISFGRGIHHCLGAPLARLEGQIAFETLLERYEDLRLASSRPKHRPNIILRGLAELPVHAIAKVPA